MSAHECDDVLVMSMQSALREAEARIAQLEAALREIDQILTCPAAEYVPAMADAFAVIDRVLKCAPKP